VLDLIGPRGPKAPIRPPLILEYAVHVLRLLGGRLDALDPRSSDHVKHEPV